MYEISFHTKFSSTWFAGHSIVSCSFYLFLSIWEYENKFHTKGLGWKSTKFFAYENFFLYSTQPETTQVLMELFHRTVHKQRVQNLLPNRYASQSRMNELLTMKTDFSTLELRLAMGAVRIRHSIREFATQPVILRILLGGKPKWLPLNFGFNDKMRTAPIGW